jgi:outer membrane protein TolC
MPEFACDMTIQRPEGVLETKFGYRIAIRNNRQNGNSTLLAETLFDAGRRRAGSDAAIAGYDAAVATYPQTALTAFQQVEDNLAALRVLENEEKQQRDAVAYAEETLQLLRIGIKVESTTIFRGSIAKFKGRAVLR